MQKVKIRNTITTSTCDVLNLINKNKYQKPQHGILACIPQSLLPFLHGKFRDSIEIVTLNLFTGKTERSELDLSVRSSYSSTFEARNLIRPCRSETNI